MIGLEKALTLKWSVSLRTKVLTALLAVPALCLLMALAGGWFNEFLKPGEGELPDWFRSALQKDRLALLRSDAWRAFWFTIVMAGLVFAVIRQWVKVSWLIAALLVLSLIDITAIDKRYFTKDQYRRKHDASFQAAAVDEEILKDKSYFRVYNLSGTMFEAQTSYFHHSIGGYHGAKIRRYQDVYDSCIVPQTNRMIQAVREGGKDLDFSDAGAINMLNVKYMIYGNREGLVQNPYACGPAWFVEKVTAVKSPLEELQMTGTINTRREAVIDQSNFSWKEGAAADSLSTITLVDQKPYWMKYESESTTGGMGVFSEIYYPKGWSATIDGKEAAILRANYVLRAVEIPAGHHVIEFTFRPAPYHTGNKVTMATSWLMVLILMGSIYLSLKRKQEHPA